MGECVARITPMSAVKGGPDMREANSDRQVMIHLRHQRGRSIKPC